MARRLIEITAKYDGKCRECGKAIPKGNRMMWARGTAVHVGCYESPTERFEESGTTWSPESSLDAALRDTPEGIAAEMWTDYGFRM